MTADPYYICDECCHFWASPEWPERCEHCGASGELHLARRETMEAAAEQSQRWSDRSWFS